MSQDYDFMKTVRVAQLLENAGIMHTYTPLCYLRSLPT